MTTLKDNIKWLKLLASNVKNAELRKVANEIVSQYDKRAIRRIDTAEKEIQKIMRTKQFKKYINTQYPKFKEKKVKESIATFSMVVVTYTTVNKSDDAIDAKTSKQKMNQSTKNRERKIIKYENHYYEQTNYITDINLHVPSWMRKPDDVDKLFEDNTKKFITRQYHTHLFNELKTFLSTDRELDFYFNNGNYPTEAIYIVSSTLVDVPEKHNYDPLNEPSRDAQKVGVSFRYVTPDYYEN